MKNNGARDGLAWIMPVCVFLIFAIISFFIFGCGKSEELPMVEGTRLEVHEHYMKTYSMHTNNWGDTVKAAYNRDMDRAKAE
jgi:hypothetical protein